MINSTSGKPTTKLFTEVNTYTKSYEQALKIIADDEAPKQESEFIHHDKIIRLGDGNYIVKQSITEKEAHKKDCKPCFLSSLIYTYARRKMLEIYSYGYDDEGNNIGSIYTDTDSLLIELECCRLMMKEHPNWFGKNFGQLEFEDKTSKMINGELHGLIIGFACFAPKCYFVFGEVIKDGKTSI
jgi:hypothetical protein